MQKIHQHLYTAQSSLLSFIPTVIQSALGSELAVSVVSCCRLHTHTHTPRFLPQTPSGRRLLSSPLFPCHSPVIQAQTHRQWPSNLATCTHTHMHAHIDTRTTKPYFGKSPHPIQDEGVRGLRVQTRDLKESDSDLTEWISAFTALILHKTYNHWLFPPCHNLVGACMHEIATAITR